MEEFNVFLSWSGPRSKAIAEAWRKYLPMMIQAAKPWMSSEDIPKGSTWFSHLTAQLKGTKIGIICITPENLLSPAIHFEAGALSNAVSDVSHVCTYLFGLKSSDLKFPLGQFQATQAIQDDTRKLVFTLRDALKSVPTNEQLTQLFEKFWPDFEKDLKAIPPTDGNPPPSRDPKEILEEVLEIVRELRRQNFSLSFSPGVFYGETDESGILYKPVKLSTLLSPSVSAPDVVVTGPSGPSGALSYLGIKPKMTPKSTASQIAEPPFVPSKESE